VKKSKWKWWLLAGLVLVLTYVWYDAFQMMSPESDAYRVTSPTAASPSTSPGAPQLEYEPPQTNPFKQPTATPQAAQPTRAQQPPAPAQLDPGYQLTGILRRDRQSQAVVTLRDSSTVLSLGDSLGVWELLDITAQAAVFSHDKNRDTLWLYTEP